MSKIIKITLMFIIILILSTSICFAIDESELYPNTTKNTISENSSINESSNISDESSSKNTNTNTNTNTNNTKEDNSVEENVVEDTNSQLVVTPTPYEDDSSTTVSGVSSISDGSAFTSILNIALIVVGVLLIFLAIAILIRLKS